MTYPATTRATFALGAIILAMIAFDPAGAVQISMEAVLSLIG